VVVAMMMYEDEKDDGDDQFHWTKYFH